MNTTEQILSLLIAERDRLDRAINALQGPVVHRGRPPKAATAMASGMAPAAKGRRRVRSAAQRRAQSEKMKAYWAKRRKDAAKG
jgi:hypothetical protein